MNVLNEDLRKLEGQLAAVTDNPASDIMSVDELCAIKQLKRTVRHRLAIEETGFDRLDFICDNLHAIDAESHRLSRIRSNLYHNISGSPNLPRRDRSDETCDCDKGSACYLQDHIERLLGDWESVYEYGPDVERPSR